MVVKGKARAKPKNEIDLGKLYDPSKNPRQWLAHQVEEKYVLYGGAKGGGKTAWGINEGIALSIRFPGNRGFMGCKDGTDFKRNALDQVMKFLPPALYTPMEQEDKRGNVVVSDAGHHKGEQYFKLINGSIIYYGGLGNDFEADIKINNFPELGWVFIDQAEQITELQFLKLGGQVRLKLPGIRYKILLTANPDPGWLRSRFIEDSKPDHIFIPAVPKDNPFLPADYEEGLRRDYPEEMVRRLVEGDWDIPGVDALIPYHQIREAINREMPATGAAVGGMDVAEFGKDHTVYIARQGNKVTDVTSWAHMDTEFSAGSVAELYRRDKLLSLNIDDIGKGGEVVVLLKSDYSIKPITVSEKASDELLYVNKRAEYYGKLAKKFEEGTISIPDHPRLSSQLASLRKKYVKGRLQIESKELMKRRGLSSPDFADALMLCFIETSFVQKAAVYIGGTRIN